MLLVCVTVPLTSLPSQPPQIEGGKHAGTAGRGRRATRTGGVGRVEANGSSGVGGGWGLGWLAQRWVALGLLFRVALSQTLRT